MLACDILYQMDLTGEDLEKVTQDFLRMLQEGIEDERVPPQDIPGISLEHVRRLLGTSAEIEGLVSFASESFEYPEGIPEFSRELVDLYMSNREEIDGLLASYGRAIESRGGGRGVRQRWRRRTRQEAAR